MICRLCLNLCRSQGLTHESWGLGPPHPLVPSPVPPLLPMLGPICTLHPIWQVIFRLQGLALAGSYDKWQE